jgi:hypothetical protein
VCLLKGRSLSTIVPHSPCCILGSAFGARPRRRSYQGFAGPMAAAVGLIG